MDQKLVLQSTTAKKSQVGAKKFFVRFCQSLPCIKQRTLILQNEGESKMYNTEEKCIELSKKFREICEAKGSTPYKLARKAGISSSTKAE